jgi:hypothetical protein
MHSRMELKTRFNSVLYCVEKCIVSVLLAVNNESASGM